MTAPVDVLAALGAVVDGECMDAGMVLMQVRPAMAALIKADKEYDAALAAIEDYHRDVARLGYADAAFSLTRALAERLVKARIARDDALARVGGGA